MPNPSADKTHYIQLSAAPRIPPMAAPTLAESAEYEFLSMIQLCNIAENHGLTRSAACNAFGGDRGKYPVEPARMARAAYIGKQLRKYVLVSAVRDYFAECDIHW